MSGCGTSGDGGGSGGGHSRVELRPALDDGWAEWPAGAPAPPAVLVSAAAPAILGRRPETGITSQKLSRAVLTVTPGAAVGGGGATVTVAPASAKIAGRAAAAVLARGADCGQWRVLDGPLDVATLRVGDRLALRAEPRSWVFEICASGPPVAVAAPPAGAAAAAATAAAAASSTMSAPPAKRRRADAASSESGASGGEGTAGGAFLPPPPASVRLGPRRVPAIGIGTLPLGVTYSGGGRPSEADATALVHSALRKGCRFFDTADMYCEGPGDTHYAERLVARAVRIFEGGRLVDEVVIGTKGGMGRTGSSSMSWAPRHFASPADLQAAIRESHAAMELGGRPIDLWSFHHTDGYPTDDGCRLLRSHCAAVLELVREGVVAAVGLANASTAHIDAAADVLGDRLVAVQNEYSPWARAADRPPARRREGPVAKSNKNNVIEWCRRRRLAFTPTKVLGGHGARDGKRDLRRDCPVIARMAAAKGVSPHALTLAWVRQAHPHTLHIVGCRTDAHLADCLEAAPRVRFTQRELDELNSMAQCK